MKTLITIFNILSVVGLSLLLFNCRKDKTPCLEDVISTGNEASYCPEMYNQRTTSYPDSIHKVDVSPGCISGPEYLDLEEYHYSDPTLNPNNSFEFAFLRNETNQFGWNDELCVYNFCTNEVNVLTDLAGYGIDWSVKDWIVFTGKDSKLYKIKSNGDSLTVLANSGDYARWNPDGTKYVCLDPSSHYKISDENGNFIQYTGFSMNSWAWLNEDEIVYAYQGNTELRKYNLVSEMHTTIVQEQGIAPPGDRMVIDENENIYTHSDEGMIRVSQMGSIELLDTNYMTYNSGYAQPLADNKILLQRYITDTTYFPCTIFSSTYISILDLNSSSEEYVAIPE